MIVLYALLVATAALFSAFSVAVFTAEIEIYAASAFFLNMILYLPAGVSGNQGITASYWLSG